MDFFGVQTLYTVSRCTTCYLLAGPVCFVMPLLSQRKKHFVNFCNGFVFVSVTQKVMLCSLNTKKMLSFYLIIFSTSLAPKMLDWFWLADHSHSSKLSLIWSPSILIMKSLHGELTKLLKWMIISQEMDDNWSGNGW